MRCPGPVQWTLDPSNLAGKHEGRDSRFLGATALEAVGANYTGGLQEGGPMLVENLLSVTSYAPYPAIRPPCVAAAIAVL
jgi:hypothetical protein